MKQVIPHECFKKIKTYFNYDMGKTYKWFQTKNPQLGFATPLEMIQLGKAQKLMKFIDSLLEDNKRWIPQNQNIDLPK